MRDLRALRAMAALVEFGSTDVAAYCELDACAVHAVVQRHEEHFLTTSRYRSGGVRWRVKDSDALRRYIRGLSETCDEPGPDPDIKGAVDHLALVEQTVLGARRLLETLDAVDGDLRHHVQDTVATFVKECVDLLTATVVDLTSGDLTSGDLPTRGEHQVLDTESDAFHEVDLSDASGPWPGQHPGAGRRPL